MLLKSRLCPLRVSPVRALGLASAIFLAVDTAPAQPRGGASRVSRSASSRGAGAAIGLTTPRGFSSRRAIRTAAPSGLRPRSTAARFGVPPVYAGAYAGAYAGPFAYRGPWAPWVYYGDHGVYPSTVTGRYPPPVATEPRLGLQTNYPFAWQMGLQMQAVSDPLYTYSLGPFRGVVRSPQEPRWLDGTADGWGLDLMKEGKFKAAGKLLAKGFRDTDDPRYPLVLAEALFALGKFEHADLVLRHALALDGAFDHLPDDVASHFPSTEVFEKKLGALVAKGGHELLAGYLQVHAKDGSVGLTALLRLSKPAGEGASPEDGDDLASRLYRHYLGKAFGGDEKSDPSP